MSLYLDTSVLVSLFIEEPATDFAASRLREHAGAQTVSDFAAAEFSSAIARLVRLGDITADAGRTTFALFDDWLARECEHVEMAPRDIAAFIRRLDLTLRAPDAINIAIAQRLGADLFTFDRKMAAVARSLGTAVVSA